MAPSPHITNPNIVTDDDGARADIARSASFLMSQLAEYLRDGGESAAGIQLMRHDLISAIVVYCPDAFLARRRGT